MNNNTPNHVAIVMDGNGRWANSRFRPRIWGHVRGSNVVSTIVETADDIGIKSLTLYAFSTENWSRPIDEIKVLVRILKKFILKEEKRIIKNNIKFKVIGSLIDLSPDVQKLIFSLEEKTKDFTGLNLTFAFSYGGRSEIIESVNKFIENNPGRKISDSEIEKYLYRPEIGDVDLLIRTGGDVRISNFLLWQVAYSELFFTPTKWPDFTKEEFLEIINQVKKRNRKFGSLENATDLNSSKINAVNNQKKFRTQVDHV